MSSTDVTPAALGKLPIALTLPDELWIKVLRHLGYKQLKRTARICKKLQRFIKGQEFDQVLYRAGPPDPDTKSGVTVRLHPMLEITEGILGSLEEARMLVWLDYPPAYFSPMEYPAILDEFATRPASIQLDIEMKDAPVERLPPLHNSTGITIREFLEHLGSFWSTPAPESDARHGMALWGFRNAKDVKYMHILEAHYPWTSWKGAVAQGGNRTKVRAGRFLKA